MNPNKNEYAPFYGKYVSQIGGSPYRDVIHQQLSSIPDFFSKYTDEKALYRYAEGKWSIKEVLGHLNDSERIFMYRALRIARGDETPLQGFDQDAFMPTGNFDQRSLQSLIDEFRNIRKSSLSLLESLSEEDLARMGMASEVPVSARALFAITAGHIRHHLTVISERY